VPPLGRILKLMAAALAGVVYLWAAAVRSTPVVKRRKAARRRGAAGTR
jgi:hypothetical protein